MIRLKGISELTNGFLKVLSLYLINKLLLISAPYTVSFVNILKFVN